MDTPAVSENLADYLADVLKAIPRLCEDCRQPITLDQGYYFNFVTRQYWHRACKLQIPGQEAS